MAISANEGNKNRSATGRNQNSGSSQNNNSNSNNSSNSNNNNNKGMAADAVAAAGGRQIPIVCPGHTRPLAELQFCYVPEEDRTLLVSACHDKMPMLRDGTTGDWIGTFAGHKGAVWSCRLDPTGSLAATASGDFSVQVWDAITGQAIGSSLDHKHIVKSCDFSHDSNRLATGGHEGILRVYNLTEILMANPSSANSTGGKATQQSRPLEILQLDSTGKPAVITKCSWWTDHILLVGCADGTVRFWYIPLDGESSNNDTEPAHIIDTAAGCEIRDLEISTAIPSSDNTSDRNILTLAAGDKVYFYELFLSDEQPVTVSTTLLHAHTMPIHFRHEGGASLHPDGTKFVAGGSDLWVRVFDFVTGQELDCCKGHHGPIRCVRYAKPHGKLYATGSEDGTIRLWKTESEE